MKYALMLLRVALTSPISDYSMLDYCAAAAGARARGAGGGEGGSDDVTPQDGRALNQSGVVLQIKTVGKTVWPRLIKI